MALFLAGLLLAFAVGSANLVALLALGLAGEGVGPEGTLALVLGGGVGCTGPVLLRSTPESLRLGLVLLFHRLALALPLLFAPNPGVFPAHAGFHALAFLAFPLAYPSGRGSPPAWPQAQSPSPPSTSAPRPSTTPSSPRGSP